MSSSEQKAFNRSIRMYRQLLRVYPKSFLDEFGDSLVQVFGGLASRAFHCKVTSGIALGLIPAFGLTRVGSPSSFLPGQSFNVTEPLVYVLAVAIAVCVSLLASLPSAWGAASVNPVAAMRSE